MPIKLVRLFCSTLFLFFAPNPTLRPSPYLTNRVDSNPLPSTLNNECRKASRILTAFIDPKQSFGPDKIIPPAVLANAKVCLSHVYCVWSGADGQRGRAWRFLPLPKLVFS